MKNSPKHIEAFVSSKHLYNGDTVLLPEFKLDICSMPKAGCTTAKWIGAHLATNLSKTSICKSTELSPSLKNNQMDNRNIPVAFSSLEWTTIVIVRDPWTRAVSSFEDQIKRKHMSYSVGNRDDFLRFTERREGWGKHTAGFAYSTCGLEHVKYDHYVDIEDFGPQLRQALHGKPEVLARLENGWENCTRNHTPSLVDSESATGHTAHITDEETLQEKNARLDQIYCNATTAAAVADRYSLDYILLQTSKPGFLTGVSHSFVSPIPRSTAGGIVAINTNRINLVVCIIRMYSGVSDNGEGKS